jgi:D-arginine dehydrogenase
VDTYDIVVIGAGIAGLSAAAELAPSCSVAVVEMESMPAHHATGRSAALYIPSYGPPAIRRLTSASREWFDTGGHGRSETTLISPRAVMYASGEEHLDHLDALVTSMGDAGGTLHPLSAAETLAMCPALRDDWVVAGGIDQDASDLDVAAIVDVFRRQLRSAGGSINVSHRVTALGRTKTGWLVTTTGGDISCGVVVNAAGAWVDEVGAMARLGPLGFVPKRRTIGISRPTSAVDIGDAFVAHAAEHFYFGREAGGVLFSPADETPSGPCDAKPEELDLALAIEGINSATTMSLRSVSASWAGLRTFSADGSIVVGPDPGDSTFIWCGGQGGYGIHTCPAASRATAALALGHPLPADLVDHGLTVEALGADRFGPSLS